MTQTPFQRAIAIVGSAAVLARALGVSPSAVHEWASGRRPLPIERCVQIERLTATKVRRWELRPDDWHGIWPELIGAEGAPAAPTPEPCNAERAA
mgnify:FL=1